MTHLLKPSVLALALVIQSCNQVPDSTKNPGQPGQPGKPPVTQASEVDPGLAFGGLTLLAGALTVIRARRRRSTPENLS